MGKPEVGVTVRQSRKSSPEIKAAIIGAIAALLVVPLASVLNPVGEYFVRKYLPPEAKPQTEPSGPSPSVSHETKNTLPVSPTPALEPVPGPRNARGSSKVGVPHVGKSLPSESDALLGNTALVKGNPGTPAKDDSAPLQSTGTKPPPPAPDLPNIYGAWSGTTEQNGIMLQIQVTKLTQDQVRIQMTTSPCGWKKFGILRYAPYNFSPQQANWDGKRLYLHEDNGTSLNLTFEPDNNILTGSYSQKFSESVTLNRGTFSCSSN